MWGASFTYLVKRRGRTGRINLRSESNRVAGRARLALVSLVERLVDVLPRRLWRAGNLYRLPGGEWHFCVGVNPAGTANVRTVEWGNREIACGRRHFDALEDESDHE